MSGCTINIEMIAHRDIPVANFMGQHRTFLSPNPRSLLQRAANKNWLSISDVQFINKILLIKCHLIENNIKRTYLSACQYIGEAALYVVKLCVRRVLVALF